MSYRIIFILVTVLLLNACSYVPNLDKVIPDRRTDYKKSEALPDLEVPPDLTTEALDNPVVIPNEEPTTLSEYQQRKNTSGVNAPTGAASEANPSSDEEWVTVQGSPVTIWPKLEEFWKTSGFTLDLDDSDLGVIETNWQETSNQGISTIRDKFKVFVEPDSSGQNSIIYITSERQEKVSGKGDETSPWLKINRSTEYEKKIVSDLNLYFYGSGATAATTSLNQNVSTPEAAVTKPAVRAEMQTLDQGKVYLVLPDEFTRAWSLAEPALQNAGLVVKSSDQSKGVYNVVYFSPEKQEKGFLSKLKFWKSSETEGELFQVSLTGVGNKTELVLLDEKGDWVDKDKATEVLTYIQSQYNSLRR